MCVLENKNNRSSDEENSTMGQRAGEAWGGSEFQLDLEVLLGAGRKESNLERDASFPVLSPVPGRGPKYCLLNQRLGLWRVCTPACV